MNITRFEPWRLIDLVDRDFRRSNAQNRNGWLPAVDVIEEQERFLLRADLPGVKPADIDISMDKGVLSLKGHRDDSAAAEENGVRRLERRSGRFERRFNLPKSADADAISARSENGILEVIIPKQAEVQARRIEVQAA